MSCHSILPSIEFTPDRIKETVDSKGLLSIELELSLRCNFRCPYCYLPDKGTLANELTFDEVKDVVIQAKELGAVKIVLLGGEPMVYPHIMEVIEYIREHEMDVEMFTNGFGITSGVAAELFCNKVNVVLKMNTFDKELQDKLTDHKGSYTIIHDALRNLKAAGYPSEDPFLAVSTVICEQNYDELPRMWQWLRDQEILPYFEIITPQGEAVENDWMEVPVSKLEALFHTIAEIDEKEYGRTWSVQPPLLGSKCLRHQFSCLIKSTGDVMPCVGVTLPVGNIRDKKLKDILGSSEVIENLRNYTETISGPCGECDKAVDCYGCRGAAYNLTGDYLGSDPLCWHNADKLDEIEAFPLDVSSFIPQTGKMKLVDKLCFIGEQVARISTTIQPDMVIVGDDLTVDPASYIELVAQATAAYNGFKHRNDADYKPEGFLVGAKAFETFETASAGETLMITIRRTAEFGEFGIIDGEIYNGEQLIAKGEIKVYHK